MLQLNRLRKFDRVYIDGQKNYKDDLIALDNLSPNVQFLQCNLLQSNSKTFFERASDTFEGMVPLTGKFVETSKKSAIFDLMLLHGCKASFDYFSILLKEENTLTLQLKESLLISRDKSALNKSIYSFRLELFK